MKKTLNINLAGYPFTIDDDAYSLLKDYLDTIRYAFETNTDTEDLAADIESRIAELLIENEEGGIRIVSKEEISKVIERIGKPSEFIEMEETVDTSFNNVNNRTHFEEIKLEEETDAPSSQSNWKKQFSRNPFVRKKLFRDPQNALLGGVCSGLAVYLNIDPTIIRILTILLFFLSASTVAIAYIILWIVVPEASTPLQRMQMKGEEPSVENIGKTVTEDYDNVSNSPQPQGGSFYRFINSLFSIFVKCLIILGLIIAVPVLIVLGAGLLGCVIAAFIIGIVLIGGISSASYGMFDSAMEGLMVFYILLAVIGGIITLGIPLWLLLMKVWKKRDINSNPNNRRSLLIVWLCGIALLAVFTVKAVKEGKELERWEKALISSNVAVPEEIEEEEVLNNVSVSEEEIKIETKSGKTVTISQDGVKIKKTEENPTANNQESPEPSVLTDSIQ